MLVKKILTVAALSGLCMGISFADQDANDVPFRIKSHISEVTCEEFLALKETHKPMFVAWADGYQAKEKVLTPINITVIESVVPAIIETCTKNPKNMVQDDIMKAIDRVSPDAAQK